MKKPVLSTILIGLILIFVKIFLTSLFGSLNQPCLKLIIFYKPTGLLLAILFLLTLLYLTEKPLFIKHKDHKIIKDILKALQDKKDTEYLNLDIIKHDPQKVKHCSWIILENKLAKGVDDTTEDQGHNAILREITNRGELYLKKPFSLN